MYDALNPLCTIDGVQQVMGYRDVATTHSAGMLSGGATPVSLPAVHTSDTPECDMDQSVHTTPGVQPLI